MLYENSERFSHRFNGGAPVCLSQTGLFCGIVAWPHENLKGRARDRVPRSHRDMSLAIRMAYVPLVVRMNRRHE
jgi:hypothetical protein